MVSPMAAPGVITENVLQQFEKVKEIVINLRAIRQQKGIPMKEKLPLQIVNDNSFQDYYPVIIYLGNLLEDIKVVAQRSDDAVSFMVGTTEFAIPLQEMFGTISISEEIAKNEAALRHKEGLLVGIQKKLSNEKFVKNASPEVIEKERKKEKDTLEIIASLKKTIESLYKYL